ncbi:MAG: hypothetical protein U0575_00520 [Phycisphaerales bacterium]|jgi:plasmid stability protein
MTNILIRGLAAHTVERLKARARRHGRSFQGEARLILERAAALSPADARVLAERWQKQLAGRAFADSAELLREDRGR